MIPLKCCFCDISQFQSIKIFLNHLRFYHSNNLDNFKCGFENCTREYGTKSSLKNHLYTHLNIQSLQQSSSADEFDSLEIPLTTQPVVDYTSIISSDFLLPNNMSLIETIKFNL